MAVREGSPVLKILLLVCLITFVKSEGQIPLTPPYFNLAQNREIIATSTCGLRSDGTSMPELFCRLTGGGEERDSTVETGNLPLIQGQLCDICDPSDPDKYHPAENAIDGTENWWQSPPLSRGNRYNEVNLTINFDQEFHVAYVFIRMANSPRPEVWVLERSIDFGRTWMPWQYFAGTASDCYKFFNAQADQRIEKDDDVICSTRFSKIVPLENGEIVVSLVNGRPSALNFSQTMALQNWTKATNVRMKLLRTKTLQGHLMDIVRQDPTVTRRYFYSIKDISIGGRCVCNGHADSCVRGDALNPSILVCNCQHNTCGNQCERCCPGFIQKKWRPSSGGKLFFCEPCECYGHSNECIYDEEVDRLGQSIDIHGRYEGGGVCQNCRDNTMGINCDRCMPGYYRPEGRLRNATDACAPCQCFERFHTGNCDEDTGRCECRPEFAGEFCDSCSFGYYDYPECKPCDCHLNGTEDALCYAGGGQCPCKPNYTGRRCDMCEFGFYNFPECLPCECNTFGSSSQTCDVETGQCPCESNYNTRDCGICADGYYNFPDCDLCECYQTGTIAEVCDKENGTCFCASNFQGSRCDRCAVGYYGLPNCYECQCASPGSVDQICREDGQCPCRSNYGSRTCGHCSPGFYSYPDCKPCNCELYGSYGRSCEQVTGQCDCRPTFQGSRCDSCKEGFYNYPICEVCNCNPAGAKEIPGYPLGGCGMVVTGQLCECKERVMGRICDSCKPGYYGLNRNNPLGCEACMCYTPGTVSGLNVCDQENGQCICKVDVTGQNCDTCIDGFYGLTENNPFGCVECDCDMGGSVSPVCDKRTGQCRCKPRVQGRRCERPESLHFYPTLHQFVYEIEDGYTPEGTPVRYGFDPTVFPDFSWRGYAVLTQVQPEVIMDININKPSLYRLIYRYHNLNDEAVRGEVVLKPRSDLQDTQRSEVFFSATDSPDFATVGSSTSMYDFVLDPGLWMISVTTPDTILLDYMVLIPQAYYEATVLQQRVTRPCTVPDDQGPCLQYNYPDITDFPVTFGQDGYIIDVDGNRTRTQVFTDKVILDELGIPALAQLNENQTSVKLNLRVPNPGLYTLVFNYYTFSDKTQTLDVNVRTQAGDQNGKVLVTNCDYSVLCRQVMKGDDDMPTVVNITNTAELTITGPDDINVAIGSVVAIPYSEWTFGYIRPNIICIRINGICIASRYSVPVGTTKIEFEDPPNESLRVDLDNMPPRILDKSTGLVRLNATITYIEVGESSLTPNQYVMAVQFYLPGEAGVDLPVNVYSDGQVYRGMFRPRYCPSVSGCRGLIYFVDSPDNHIVNLPTQNVRISFNNTFGKEIWLDYVMLIPARLFSPSDLNLQPVDNSAAFLKNCVGPGFQLLGNTEFCREGTFTLTTDFNNGAVACECDIDGSMSFECDRFGGQCQCRQNVIGRQCTDCREGYYGFPNCKACDCPFGMCQPFTGDCICPPRVVGERCDQCAPETYGYDALVGCTDCSCNRYGSSDLDCDKNTGLCTCIQNVGGRKCDHCLAGYRSFPSCTECDCDATGTSEEICDQNSGVCQCKDYVGGRRCDRCEPGYFNIDPMNKKGCTPCFCFGATSTCEMSSMYWSEFQDMGGWGITNTVEGSMREAGSVIAVLDILEENKIVNPDEAMYWTAPKAYLGNKVSSYGGKLRFMTIAVLPREDDTDANPLELQRPDIIIAGPNGTITYMFEDVPGQVSENEVLFTEKNFIHSIDGSKVTRDQFMMLLTNISALLIRANFYTDTKEVRLQNVKLEVARRDGLGDQAITVEQCLCPYGYNGTSCESCSQGYYRSRSFPYLGVCSPCDCNGHADKCDPETGRCLECRGNTFGDHCEQCLPGYYGDPVYEECRICRCPLPVPGNNFATGCTVYEERLLSCDCIEGYTGTYCERCAPGYYGNPMEEGNVCRPCDCSGNIDMNDPNSCSITTGACLICLNNSTGPACSLCRDWWYGDAVNAKNCQACQCDQCGSEVCDNSDGRCTCRPNVVGVNCDRCAPDTYGFNDCNGCDMCDCALGSRSTQCDLRTGQCPCTPGTTGRYCERCINGYWNYTGSGCQECNCESDGAITCSQDTGVCQCLPGVAGERCDRCKDRWVLVPQEGCQPCDNCVHILLDDMDSLELKLSTSSGNLAGISAGVSAYKRLAKINQTVEILQPEVDNLFKDTQDIDLSPLLRNLNEVRQIEANITNRANAAARTGRTLVEETRLLLESSYDAGSMASHSEENASAAVQQAKDVLNRILQRIQVTNVETYIQLSEQIMEEILSRNFTLSDVNCEDEMNMALALLDQVKMTKLGGASQEEDVKNILKNLTDVDNRLYDLQNNSRVSNTNSYESTYMLDRLIQVLELLKDRLRSVGTANSDTVEILDQARKLLDEAQDFNNKSRMAIGDVESLSTRMDAAIASLQTFVNETQTNMENMPELVNRSMNHAEELRKQAAILENMYMETRDLAAIPTKAAKAYQDIVDAINDAYNASQAAVQASEDALGKSNGVGNTSATIKDASMDLLMNAKKRFNITKIDLSARLKEAKESTDIVEILIDGVEKGINQLNIDISALPSEELSQRANDAALKADNAEQAAIGAQNKVQDILNKLPQDKIKIEELANSVTKTEKYVTDAEEQTKYVKKEIPQIRTLINLIGVQKQTVQGIKDGVMFNITELRKKIALARSEANRIRVGMEFLGNSTVTLRNPPNIDQAGSYSKVSMYVKTTQRDGLLSYIGSEMIPDRPVPDYLALELRNGNPVFKFNLGSGPGEIVHPWNIADGNWYKLTAERIGKTGYLTVNRDEKLGEPELRREGNSSGTFTVLELNPVTTKFYVGGVPDVILVPFGVQRANFEGFIEDIGFDESPMGLWNFIYGENNYMGAIERSELRTGSTTGFRFNGKGYVILDASEINFKPNRKGSIILQFKTYARNGLLMYMGKGRDFTSLELRDGKVLFQYDLGGMPAKLMSNKTYNDGEWHKIQAERNKQIGSLLIDRGDSVRGESPGTLTELAYTNDIFIGGYNKPELPVSKYVESIGFDGCIENVQFNTQKIDLNRNKVALGVVRGCPAQTLRTASFREGQISYVAYPSDSVGVNFDVTFRMKTLSNDSLLLYTTNDEQTTAFSVSVVDGQVIVTSNPGNDLTRLESKVNTYNDGRWHYISIMKMGNKLMMNIDDQEMVNKTARTFADNVVTERPLYFGATDFTVAEELVGSTQPFFGCMSDVTINGRFLNFAEIPENYVNRVSFTECPLEDPEIDITIVPTLPPFVTEPTNDTAVETTTPAVTPCALPLTADLTGAGGTVDGTRFGIQRDSRQELQSLISSLRVRSRINVDIRTWANTGLIFYTSDAKHVDHISISMLQGRVVFMFNCGTGSAVITSPKQYNDGKWHTISVYRNQKSGTLTIDGEEVGKGESKGSTRSLNVIPPHYLGGLPDDVAAKAKGNLKEARGSFSGCIKNFLSANKQVPEASITNYGTIEQCNSMLESGSFFHTNGGYVQLYEQFSVGLDLSFTIAIRPRNLTGVILAVHAGSRNGDFMLLEMVNGQIVFKADNGKGIFTARYIPPLDNTLCDGNWHTIEASKAKSVLLLRVDGSKLNRGVGEAGTSETNTNDELFVGGIPDLSRRGVEANGNFIGCIRNFELDGVPQYLASGTVHGSVKTDSCPVS